MSRITNALGACLVLLVLQVAFASGSFAQNNEALSKRIDQLSEQIIDLKVEIGTLESLARSRPSGSPQQGVGAGASAGYGASGGDRARLDGMETQIRALTAQIESLSRDVRLLKNQGGGATSSPGYSAAPPSGYSPLPSKDYQGRPSGFGTTTVTPQAGRGPGGGNQDGGGYAARNDATGEPYGAGGYSYDSGPQKSYETAYGYLLQQDYAAAQSAFAKFLSHYPSDRLAGNAQYWLGETYYVRGQYRSAAGAFLKGYKSYAKSQKAPDSLLKLAMSLNKLGQKDAACSSFSELSTRFPKAPKRIVQKARTEKRNAGC